MGKCPISSPIETMRSKVPRKEGKRRTKIQKKWNEMSSLGVIDVNYREKKNFHSIEERRQCGSLNQISSHIGRTG